MLGDSKIKVHLALLLVSAIYGFFYVAIKLLLITLHQEEVLWLRFLLTAIIVMSIEWSVFKTRINHLLQIILLSLLGVYAVQMFIIIGLKQTSAFHASLIMASVPIITLVLSLLMRREIFSWRKFWGILLAFSGVAIVLSYQIPSSGLLSQDTQSGNLWMLLAALCFAGFLLASQSLLKRYPPYSLMSYSYGISALALSLTFLPQRLQQSPEGLENLSFLTRLGPLQWALMAYVVICASILSYTLNNYALKRVAPTIVAIYMFLSPIQSAIWGALLLNEPFHWVMGLAGVLTFVGIIMANVGSEKSQEAELSQVSQPS